jgi:hypothetical protein
MAKIHSKNTVVTVDSDDLSAYTNTSEYTRTGDEHDTTTYGPDDARTFSKGLTNGQFTMGGFYDSTASTGPRAVLDPLVDSDVVTVVRRPEGTGSGRPQDSFSGLCTEYKESSPVADFVTWTASFRISGVVTSTAQGA